MASTLTTVTQKNDAKSSESFPTPPSGRNSPVSLPSLHSHVPTVLGQSGEVEFGSFIASPVKDPQTASLAHVESLKKIFSNKEQTPNYEEINGTLNELDSILRLAFERQHSTVFFQSVEDVEKKDEKASQLTPWEAIIQKLDEFKVQIDAVHLNHKTKVAEVDQQKLLTQVIELTTKAKQLYKDAFQAISYSDFSKKQEDQSLESATYAAAGAFMSANEDLMAQLGKASTFIFREKWDALFTYLSDVQNFLLTSRYEGIRNNKALIEAASKADPLLTQELKSEILNALEKADALSSTANTYVKAVVVAERKQKIPENAVLNNEQWEQARSSAIKLLKEKYKVDDQEFVAFDDLLAQETYLLDYFKIIETMLTPDKEKFVNALPPTDRWYSQKIFSNHQEILNKIQKWKDDNKPIWELLNKEINYFNFMAEKKAYYDKDGLKGIAGTRGRSFAYFYPDWVSPNKRTSPTEKGFVLPRSIGEPDLPKPILERIKAEEKKKTEVVAKSNS